MEPWEEFDRSHLWLFLQPVTEQEFDDYVEEQCLTPEQYAGTKPLPEPSGFSRDAGLDEYDPDFAHFQYCGPNTPVAELFDDTDVSEDKIPGIISSCMDNGISHATAVCLLSDSSHSDTPFTERNGLVYIGEFDMD